MDSYRPMVTKDNLRYKVQPERTQKDIKRRLKTGVGRRGLMEGEEVKRELLGDEYGQNACVRVPNNY